MMLRLRLWLGVTATLSVLSVELHAVTNPTPEKSPKRATPVAVFDDVTKLVKENFYDKTFRGMAWDTMVASERAALVRKPSDAHLQRSLAQLLSSLNASHTQFLTSDDQEYWALQSIFSGRLDGAQLRHPGAWFERRGARWFVRNVLKGSKADEAGLMRGDEILGVKGKTFRPVLDFAAQKPNERVRLRIRRVAWEKPRTIEVGTEHASFQESFLKAMRASRRNIKLKGGTVAYVWLPTGTHDAFREELMNAARDAEEHADALVLDLRDGFGGADLAFLDPFFETLDNKKPDPSGGESPPVKAPLFTKKLVTLVNGGTRSGKEWLAWFIKKHARGPLVGQRTAGSFLAGRLFDVTPNRYALYLAVADTKGMGVSLEGRGVEPDVAVEAPLPYAAGQDPILDQALQLAIATR